MPCQTRDAYQTWLNTGRATKIVPQLSVFSGLHTCPSSNRHFCQWLTEIQQLYGLYPALRDPESRQSHVLNGCEQVVSDTHAR
jgi:ABC-type branched-subunit amino acid transport system ATPase component